MNPSRFKEDLEVAILEGKANGEGKLKSTVAGELAYDDMLKRSREGRTEGIDMDDLDEAVMDADSEVTSDNASSVHTLNMLRTKDKAVEVLSQKYTDKNKYFEILSEVGKYLLSSKGSPYEGLYILSEDIRKRI